MIDCMKDLMSDKYFKTTFSPLELEDPDSHMKVSITGLPKNGLIICIPTGVHLSIVKDKIKGGAFNYKQSCDKLILIPTNRDINAYFIEMKKTFSFDNMSQREKACNQILGTIPILDYLISMVKLHFGKQCRVKKYYFVIIAEKRMLRLNKGNVKARTREKNQYKNRNFKIIYSSKTIPFIHLQ